MIEAVFMLFSAFMGEFYHETAVTSIYLSSAITVTSGAILAFLGRKRRDHAGSVTKREVYLTVRQVSPFSTPPIPNM